LLEVGDREAECLQQAGDVDALVGDVAALAADGSPVAL
jgi:hypothetical protein